MKIINARVLNLHNGNFEEKTLGVHDGKFAAPENENDVFDCQGLFITPGLIDAHSHLGLWEAGLGVEGADGNEMSDPLTPHLMALDGINPFDTAFQDARSGGVTTVSTGPGSTNIMGGLFTIIKTIGSTVDEMTLCPASAMKWAFGENPKHYYGANGKMPITRMSIAGEIRRMLHETQYYMEARKSSSSFVYQEKLEALIPVLERKIPVKIHAHRADDIATAIRLGKEFNLRLSLDHCTEGHLIVDAIRASGYPVIVGPTFGFQSKVELRNKTFDTPRILAEAGIQVAIMTDHPVHPQSSLILWAAMSHKAGLPESEAFRSITIVPAQILGIDDKVGSIEPGKDADLVFWDRHPFDLYAQVKKVMINGQFCE
ncbi:MAG: amidohydrolase [Anaerolineaceae bacterium]|nr:amidohydrolase [Anaerolineaceae bacterium]